MSPVVFGSSPAVSWACQTSACPQWFLKVPLISGLSTQMPTLIRSVVVQYKMLTHLKFGVLVDAVLLYMLLHLASGLAV